MELYPVAAEEIISLHVKARSETTVVNRCFACGGTQTPESQKSNILTDLGQGAQLLRVQKSYASLRQAPAFGEPLLYADLLFMEASRFRGN